LAAGCPALRNVQELTTVTFGTLGVKMHVTLPILRGLKYRLKHLESDAPGRRCVSSVRFWFPMSLAEIHSPGYGLGEGNSITTYTYHLVLDHPRSGDHSVLRWTRSAESGRMSHVTPVNIAKSKSLLRILHACMHACTLVAVQTASQATYVPSTTMVVQCHIKTAACR
jgi:hypothetical protein